MIRSVYYDALKITQRSLDLTSWLAYYFGALHTSVDLAVALTDFTIRKVRYLDRFGPSISATQEKALGKMWEAGPEGYSGWNDWQKKLWMSQPHVSPATATRDLAKLTVLGALERRGAGRSTHYVLPKG